MEFEILHLDEDLVVITKPSGILVHRTEISTDRIFVLQELRNQIGQEVFPVHRLDRPTSGVLVFALTSTAAANLSAQFSQQEVSKSYLAVVRGWFEQEGLCDYALDEKEAQTNFCTLSRLEFNIPQREFERSRFSIVEAKPHTGRFHQIRLHLRHLRHPILGDTAHGDGFQNQIFREHFQLHRLLLHSFELSLKHPSSGDLLHFQSQLPTFFHELQNHSLLHQKF